MRSRKYLYMAPSLVPHRTALLIVLLLLTCELQSCSAWESHNQGDDEAKALPHRRDLVVRGLEQHVPAFADFDGEMYAGLIPMDNDNPNARGATAANPQRRRGELMFWLFAPRETANPNALTIWLNGGPGCTSFGAGLFLENSPVTVQPRPAGYCCLREDEPLQYNRYAWTNASALLYIEQPVSVGFSRGGPVPANEDELSGDVYAWLLNFYRVFDEYQDSQLFIFGESYAGTCERPVFLSYGRRRAPTAHFFCAFPQACTCPPLRTGSTARTRSSPPGWRTGSTAAAFRSRGSPWATGG
jgi:hypothetical protein